MSASLKVPILDHGYVQFIESWGTEERIIESARMSVGGGFVSWEPYEGHPRGDLGLLEFLYRKKHTTPFEMAGLVVEVQAPIMVFREWHRHRTQSYNEMSARYSPLPDANYLPTKERCLVKPNAGNKQAAAVKGTQELTEADAEEWLRNLSSCYSACQNTYQHALNLGVPKELARLCLPVGRYSRMRASANLLNWIKFLVLREATDAQYEIRVFANEVSRLVSELFPRTWRMYNDGRLTVVVDK